MPVTVAFEPPAQFVVRAAANVTHEEVIAGISEMLAHPGMSGKRTVLIAAQDVTGAPGTDELRAIVQATKQLVARGVVAIALVTPPGFVYGVARTFVAYAELADIRVRAVLDPADARRWLDESLKAAR